MTGDLTPPSPSTPGAGERLLLSVLATAQKPSRDQRKGRYTPESMRHPGKMLPAIAAQVITAFTRPGDLVVDPMCGIGTTLVEAAHLGRHAIGMEYEADFARMAAANMARAYHQGACGTGSVVWGDARTITGVFPYHHRQAALVLTSPPYGAHTHGHVTTGRDNGGKVTKANHRYSRDRANLAHQPLPGLMEGFERILTGAAELLKPGGIAAITVRPIRVRGVLVDLPGAVIEAAERADLVLTERLVALLAGLRGGGLVPRTSFFQGLETRRARDRGLPACATAHEDLLVFQRPIYPKGER
ncbi:TRM11 family SAM-dependent methyltransferase [Actinomadura parmotrematis]|uniref:Methyltransferase n=1 Tax=Actinomadura parmotrematis TaxID=2864039 RepID=A0ABS7G5Y2_9ACTN|nr:DNA methyltransferase [Actinomadura parmotrematis]MBW8487284.1 site-specific DNA-methyltransferase [Actinomadura parmotrematis]